MTDEEIIRRAEEAEKRTQFGELVYNNKSRRVISAYGIGFIEGMVEYRKYIEKTSRSQKTLNFKR